MTWPSRSPRRSASGARTRSGAWTHSTSSSSLPTRSTRSAARSGTKARKAGHKQAAKDLKGALFTLRKNPHNLTDRQKIKLAQIQQTNKPPYRAYLISQQLREIYRVPLEIAVRLLDAWLAWARRCRLAPFVKLAKTITKQRFGIKAAIRHGLSNAQIEQVNTQLRLITRRAYRFRTPEALTALAMLSLGGLCPPLPA